MPQNGSRLPRLSRKVDSLAHTIADFQQIGSDLERQIAAEEERTRIKDRTDVAYSTLAIAATHRREKLVASIAELLAQLAEATRERDDLLVALAATAQNESSQEQAEVRRQRRRRMQHGLFGLPLRYHR